MESSGDPKASAGAEPSKTGLHKLSTPFIEIFGLSRSLASLSVLLCAAVIFFGVYWFVHSAPPQTVIITSGAPGSSFATNAERYRVELKKKGFELKILPSQGSSENLKRLNDKSYQVDVGFVQGGITNDSETNTLVSLGSINYEPLLVFYRSKTPVTLLSGFAGQRVAIGAAGSGTRQLALELLRLNGIAPGGSTKLVDLDGDEAAQALLAGKIDAVFLMGDITSIDVMKALEHDPGIGLFDFTQADGYIRRIPYLNKLVFPQGSIDFGKNIPAHDVNLIGPTVELIARPELHPALSDLLIEVAQKVNGKPSLFKHRNEFPAPIVHDFPISAEAQRYYASGKRFKFLPFWLASRVNTVLVAFVPMLVLLIPALKLIPGLYRWQMQMRINRWYRELLTVERSILVDDAPGKRSKMLGQIAHIENEVNRMKVPASFADQFYNLRGHILFVRDRLKPAAPSK